MTRDQEEIQQLRHSLTHLRTHHTEILRDHGKAIAALTTQVTDTDRDALRAAIGTLNTALSRLDELEFRNRDLIHALNTHGHVPGKTPAHTGPSNIVL